ncbi:MAG TPA: hypothetical protein VMW89_11605 [Desulfatiglandales bacterium]|nr:hypothetical protein [Desulfatiglandales bacterium]
MYKRFAFETALILKLLLPQGFINRDFRPLPLESDSRILGAAHSKKIPKRDVNPCDNDYHLGYKLDDFVKSRK